MRNYQTVAEVIGRLMQERPIATFPRSARKIAAEAGKTSVHIGELGKRGDRAADASVQVGMGASPVCAEEPIATIVRHRKRMDLDGPEGRSEHLERRTSCRSISGNGGKIVCDQPKNWATAGSQVTITSASGSRAPFP